MTSVYLVNIGANTSHSGRARSPIFEDGSWVFVSFPTSTPQPPPEYSSQALPFLRGVGPTYTHADPCWDDLTYGDDCTNPRAGALKGVIKGDILLFWGLLWRNRSQDWHGFTGERGWYLFGALRVEEIADREQTVQQVSEHNRLRAGRNAHFVQGGGLLPKNNRVFLGDPRYSSRFSRAVDLETSISSGLIYRAFTSSNGDLLTRGRRPLWSSSLRSCRKIWDLNDPVARSRAQIVGEVIVKQSDFDFLEDL
ncbi:hypothetical protein [Synechococcus sp. CBW1107]|uniref:Nmad3 family putative nucleotide modification protein n=1 Tax=Synechococcus sp. CBW1107 TaxID=2789857 RepID=UPI002AD4EAF6|nr:hypothetical protein [Synechococcus sp. CBW1107]CAK6695303.1 hypothetical protein ICNINCKA_01797 [Synechococcus sp. CBW1107]